jgi:hypothetical protein
MGEDTMLAAENPTDAWFGVFRIALLMTAEERFEIPEELRTYFNEIINQTKCLIENRCEKGIHLLPEAIDLAYRAKIEETLKENFYKIESLEKTTPVIAKEVLSAMESYAD